MNKKLLLSAAIAGALSMVGCTAKYSEVPIAKNFPATGQEKLQAAAHWDVVSAHIASKLIWNLGGKLDKNAGVYVSSNKSTPFNRAIESELVFALLEDKYKVVKNPSNAINIQVTTEVVEFSEKRLQNKNIGVPTALVAGVWALAAADATAGGVATAAVATADFSRGAFAEFASGETPKTEIMITITASDKDQYIALTKGTYYVTDSDRWLYDAVQTKNFAITGEK